jgi:hypothetical protein
MFCLMIISGAKCASKVIKFPLLLCLLLCVLIAIAPGQTGSSRSPVPASEIYGGIELSDEGVKVIALQVIQGDDESGLRPIYKEVTRLVTGRTSSGDFPPQASTDAAKAVMAALTRLRRDYRVPLDRIYLIGGSGLKADHPKDLESVIRNTTGLQLEFLDPIKEVQLSIVGTIPRVSKSGNAPVDNRNTSMLIHIGGSSTQGGYEMLKYSPSDSPAFDYVAMSIPHGVVNYANEISRVVGPNANQYAFAREVKASGAINFRQALHKEMDTKPSLMTRKRVYITGNLAWAMATLMYPDNREIYVPISYDAIMQFADRVSRSPREMVEQDLSYIRDRKLRLDVQQEIEQIKATFLPQQLMAGAEMLKAMAEELQWKEKKIMFARFGNLGCLSSYVRLQIDKIDK